MDCPDPNTVTQLLHEVRAGDTGAVDALLPLVYAELRGLAAAVFSNERSGHTLQPTALIHEAWLKLAGHLGELEHRRHFYAVAARAMRQVLTDHARTARRDKRAGPRQRVTIDQGDLATTERGLDLIDLEDSLQRLASFNERHARMVELRFFAGLSIPETAATLGISHATVERDWFAVRAWLRRELGRSA